MDKKIILLLCVVASIAGGFYYYQYKVPHQLQWLDDWGDTKGVVNIDDIVSIHTYTRNGEHYISLSLKNSKELTWYRDDTFVYTRSGDKMRDISPLSVVD